MAAGALGALAAPASAADLVPAPCPEAVQTAARTQLPTATDIKCRVHRSEAEAGGAPAGTVDQIEANVALGPGRIATLDVTPQGKVLGVTYTRVEPANRERHSDLVNSSGKGMALLFWAFALASVVGGVFVITRRNLIAAVMGMVGSFLGIAAVYMMLYAQFLAVVQMLVYAGAIMVLFVFVVMILNRPEDEPVAPSGRAGQALGGLAILYLVFRLIVILTRVEPPNLETAMAAPLPTAQGHDWGSIGAVGTDLFGPGLFPFEAISILLLVAVVGAIAIARPLREEGDVGGSRGDSGPGGGAE
jgi:NADH-quinone oxidoreductase subunit J